MHLRTLFIEPFNVLLKVRNGLSELSPLMLINSAQGSSQNGRLCGDGGTVSGNTSSNALFVNFRTDGSGSGAGFLMEYRELSNNDGCGPADIFLDDSQDQVYLTTPRFPNTPPPHSECVWLIHAPRGKTIQLGQSTFRRPNVNVSTSVPFMLHHAPN